VGAGAGYRSSRGLPPGACSQGPAPIRTTASARRSVNSLTRKPVRSNTSTATRTRSRLSFWAALSSFAAVASSSALGSGWSRRGRSPENIGTLFGASSQPHSSIRTKNIRRVPSR